MPKRPPKKWWDMQFAKTREQYPKYSMERLRKIVGSIWWNLPRPTRERIIEESESGNPNGGLLDWLFN